MSPRLRLRLVGVGAMASPRYAPAGLLVSFRRRHVLIDGGGPPPPSIDAWLLTDARCELIASIRAAARATNIVPRVDRFDVPNLSITPHPVVHTSHATFGYRIDAKLGRRRVCVVWAPEFFAFPKWAARADLMFAEAASFSRAIAFVGGVGGHMPAIAVAQEAKRRGVRRLVFAHIGRSSIRARDAGVALSFGEWGNDGQCFIETARSSPGMQSAEDVAR